MSATERRLRLLTVLCFRRRDTCENLAREFDVTIRTIYSDIEVLMCSYPIETVRGRYGGVKVADGFYLGNHALSPQQFELLNRLKEQLAGDDLAVMESILIRFAP